MDFDHSGVVVSQEDITLESADHEGDIPMEFEHIEEQQMLMDTGSEEIIGNSPFLFYFQISSQFKNIQN